MSLSSILNADFWTAKVVSCQPLAGASGDSYGVQLENRQRFLLRRQNETLQRLGAGREFEADLLFSLQLLPFVPSVFHQGNDFLVQHWVEGEPLAQWNEPHLAQLALNLQQLHHFSVLHSAEINTLPQLDLIRRIFSLLQQLPSEQHGGWLMQLDQLTPFVESEIQVIAHHDLHPHNIIVQPDGSFKLLDWEYAAWSEPALEMAFLLANNELSQDQQRYLLQYYLQGNTLLQKEWAFGQAIASYLPWVKLLNRLWWQVRQTLASESVAQ
ncbi:phosphotransferase [Testudinibacter sp. P80/BLE/0925]|uniref:phosphotransferase n=1 Tax=Testudinibacter sp. TW-1 TaxID=3417757 RepID=UPI003D35BB73